jgi:adenylate cyclase
MTTPSAAPAETITGAIMFTDIAGFTEFTALQGDEEALGLLALQERIVSNALPANARIVKELGDGLLLWFADAAEAVSTALRFQCQFEAEASESLLPLWVRIGIHWGRPALRRGDIVGHDVNVASRICDFATPGETVVSEATWSLACNRLRGVQFEELGPVVMKGIPAPIPLFRVTAHQD